MLRLVRSSTQESVPRESPADPLAAIARSAASGNTEAQRTLLVAVGPALLRVVRGVLGSSHPDVDDTLQEALMRVHLALPEFRYESSTLHFAARIAVHTAMNARRRAGYRAHHTPNAEPGELADLALDERSPAEEVAAERRREKLRQLLCELPEPQAEVLALHALLGHTVEETAAATGVPVNTVRSRLRSALSKLRARVRDDEALLEAIEGGA